MGDISNGILDGEFDSMTGEYIGPGQGFPRSYDKNSPDYVGKQERDPNRKMNPQFGVEKYLRSLGITANFAQITDDYFVSLKKAEEDHKKRCEHISANFGAFVKWLIKRKK